MALVNLFYRTQKICRPVNTGAAPPLFSRHRYVQARRNRVDHAGESNFLYIVPRLQNDIFGGFLKEAKGFFRIPLQQKVSQSYEYTPSKAKNRLKGTFRKTSNLLAMLDSELEFP